MNFNYFTLEILILHIRIVTGKIVRYSIDRIIISRNLPTMLFCATRICETYLGRLPSGSNTSGHMDTPEQTSVTNTGLRRCPRNMAASSPGLHSRTWCVFLGGPTASCVTPFNTARQKHTGQHYNKKFNGQYCKNCHTLQP